MRYTYLDILFDMARANVAPTGTLRLHTTDDYIRWSDYGPVQRSTASYTTPEGAKKLDFINGGQRYA